MPVRSVENLQLMDNIETRSCDFFLNFKIFFSRFFQVYSRLEIYINELINKPNKKISVFKVTCLKTLGRVGTHIFFRKKSTILCILKGISPFKMHKIIFFSRRPEKKYRFHQ